jgi:hypothetical protein
MAWIRNVFLPHGRVLKPPQAMDPAIPLVAGRPPL